MLPFSPDPGNRQVLGPSYQEQLFGSPYQGQQFVDPYQGQQFGPPYQGQQFVNPYQGQQFVNPYQGQQFGGPYQGQQFGQNYDNRWNPAFMPPNNSSQGMLGNLPNHINTLMGHASTIQNGYNMMRQLGSVMGLFK